MDDNARPNNGPRFKDCSHFQTLDSFLAEEGITTPQPHAHEIDLLTEVAEIVRQAIVEYQTNNTVAARYETLRGINRLQCVLSGDAV
jgi:hypothetical protein